jgi:hypothetical protein
MTREYRRKKGSVKKRKRRGFYGVRPQEKATETRNDPTTSSGNLWAAVTTKNNVIVKRHM